MSRLSDVIGQVIQQYTDAGGNLVLQDAAKAAFDLLDKDDRDHLTIETLVSRIKQAAGAARKSASKIAEQQGEFPFENIRRAYALSDGSVKLTEMMRMFEFCKLIEIRSKQLADDTSHLDDLRSAYRSLEPIWREHPAATFGEACRLFVGARGAA